MSGPRFFQTRVTTPGPKGTSKAVQLLYTALVDRGWSQSRLGKELALTPSAVGGWLSGKSIPELRPAIAMEDLLGVPARAWLEE
jgi:transcriptional regulator with XRE-family HTH domain